MVKRIKWTEENVATLLTLRRRGLNNPSIAKAMNIKELSVRNKLCQVEGLKATV